MKVHPIDYSLMDSLFYIDENNHLRNKVRRGNAKAGELAGTLFASGTNNYIRVKINSKLYSAHRIIWVLRHKHDIPSGKEVDHKVYKYVNWKGYSVVDNSASNMRLATKSENQWNSEGKGYSFDKNLQKFRAYIRVFGKLIRLGYFDCEKAARQAYVEAKNFYHGRFTPKDIRMT